jgi:hypothetical protein
VVKWKTADVNPHVGLRLSIPIPIPTPIQGLPRERGKLPHVVVEGNHAEIGLREKDG